jgi:hypothetical protein
MACPDWQDCDKKNCIEQQVCMGDYWINYWKNKPPRVPSPTKSNPCPFVHLCGNVKCRTGSMCQDKTYWSHYWRKKTEREEMELGISKKERRSLRKTAKKAQGRKRFRMDELEKAHREIYSNTPHCVKNEITCDKGEACSFLNRCVMTLEGVKNFPDLVEALRGPHSLKRIISLLAKYNPGPIKSYYRQGK